jgi:hypothetical protein
LKIVERIHYSKQDLWLSALIWGGLAVAAVAVMFSAKGDIADPALRLLIACAPVAVTLLLIYPLYYRITGDELLVRCGFLRYRVPVAGIRSVTPSRNPLSSPAMSLDRLSIKYTHRGRSRELLISPRDKQEFIQDLSLVAGHLRIEGDSLVQR